MNVFLYLIVIAISSEDCGTKATVIPQYGVLMQKVGTIQLVEGLLLARSNLNIHRYLEDNAIRVYVQMKNVLDRIAENRQGLTNPEIATLERKIGSSSFLFRQLLEHMPDDFVQQKLNISDYTRLETEWRNLVYDKLHGQGDNAARHCVCPFPECEAPCHRDIQRFQNEEEDERDYPADDASHEEDNRTPCNATEMERDALYKIYRRPLNDNEICTVLDEFLRTVGRAKRGLLNIGGNALNVLFGTATETQLLNTNKSLHQVQIATQELQIRSHHLEGMVTHSLEYMKKVFQELDSNHSELQALRNFILLAQLVDEVNAITRHLLTISIEVETRISLLKQGIVPPMLTDEQLIQLIKEGRQKFLKLDFPLPTNNIVRANHSKYMGLLKAISTVDPQVFLITIPFTNPRKKYEVTRFITFPTKNVEGDLVIPEVKPYIGISNDDYIIKESLEECYTLENTFLCSTNVEKNTNFTTCEHALLSNDSLLIEKTCRFYATELIRDYYAIPFIEGWYLYFDKPQYGNINCPGDRESIIKKLQGFVILRAPCTLKIPDITFSTLQTILLNATDGPTQNIPLLKVNATAERKVKPHTALLNAIDKDLLRIKEVGDKMHFTETDISVQVPIIFTVVCIVAIITLGIIVLTYTFRRNNNQFPWERNRRQMKVFRQQLDETRNTLLKQQSQMLHQTIDRDDTYVAPPEVPIRKNGPKWKPECTYIEMDAKLTPPTKPRRSLAFAIPFRK